MSILRRLAYASIFFPVALAVLPGKFATAQSGTTASGVLTAVSMPLATPSGVPGRYIITYRAGYVPANAGTHAAALGGRVSEVHAHLGTSVVEFPVASPAASAALRERLANDPAIEMIVEDRVVSAHSIQTLAVPSTTAAASADTYYNSPAGWAVRAVGGFGPAAGQPANTTPGPWTVSQGKGVRIAVLDTGVDQTHPDIAPNLALNLSEVDQHALPSACDDGTAQDQQGHGTWTASLAAGAMGPNTGMVVGVAPAATILNIKVLERMPSTKSAADPTGCAAGQGSGLLSWVLKGINDAVANHADIVSMSLGTLVDVTTGDGAGLKATFDHATHAASNAGVILIAAAGNDGVNLASGKLIELPAQARDVVTILAATNPACTQNLKPGATCTPGPVGLPYYSNYGVPNALAAPGGSYPAAPDANPTAVSGWVRGACSNGKPGTLNGAPADHAHSFGCFGLGHTGYVQAMGTSASAPLAAGAAALIKGAHPTWNAAAVIAAMHSSAVTSKALPAAQLNVALVVAAPVKH